MTMDRGPEPEAMSAEERHQAVLIDRLLQDEAEIFAAVRVGAGVAYLDGIVESAAQVEAATDLALRVAGITRVRNDLEVEELGLAGDQPPAETPLYDEEPLPALTANEAAGIDLDTNPDHDYTTNAQEAAEEGLPYLPPTDPVVHPSDDPEGLEIATGFGTSSTDEFPDLLATTALGDAPPGDEDIRSQVLEALRSDAMTIDLVIDVVVQSGVVYLRGQVPTLTDAEAAEEVAGRVPTVREVVEELEIVAQR